VTLSEVIEEHGGSGAFDVAGGGKQGRSPVAAPLGESVNRVGGWSFGQLGLVAPRELLEAAWVVAVPAAQIGAGGDVFRPFVDVSIGFLEPSRPEAVD
jgi:hypothetical protein